jgi:hypothetical protein
MLTKLLLMKCLLNKGLSTNAHCLLSTQYLKTMSINLLNVTKLLLAKCLLNKGLPLNVYCLLSVTLINVNQLLTKCLLNKGLSLNVYRLLSVTLKDVNQTAVDKMSSEQNSVSKCLPSIVRHPNECQPNCC